MTRRQPVGYCDYVNTHGASACRIFIYGQEFGHAYSEMAVSRPTGLLSVSESQ